MNQHQSDQAATATSPKRVPAIYIRSATDGEGQLEERLEDARELARLHALDVAQDHEIAEHGSGTNIHRRPGIERIMQMAARGEISHLVILDTSHLNRDYHDLRQILIRLAEAGVTVVTGELVGTNSTHIATLVEPR